MNFLNYWRVLHVLGFINICSWLMITYQTNFSKMILRRPYHVYLSAFQLLWQRKCTSQKWHLEGRNVFIYKYKAQSMSTIGFSAFSQRKWISQKWQLEGRIMFIYKYKSKLLQLSAFLRHWQRKCTSQKLYLEGRDVFIYKHKVKTMSNIGFGVSFSITKTLIFSDFAHW